MPVDISVPYTEGSDLFGALLCDPYQNLHILWGKSHDQGSDIYYRTDVNGVLSTPTDVLATSNKLAIRLSTTILETDDSIHLIWQDSYVRGNLFYSSAKISAAESPGAWMKPQLLVPQVDSARIMADSKGTLHLIYGISSADGYKNSVYYARSDDGGTSWQEPILVYEADPGVPSALSTFAAVDMAGRIHVGITLRSQEYGVASELLYTRSLDGGYTWQPAQVVATQSEATPNVAVIAPFAFGEDEIHLTWHDPRRMHMWSSDGGATWSSPVEIFSLGAGFGSVNNLAKDSAGKLYAVVGAKDAVYQLEWDGLQWIKPTRIENRSLDPHAQELVVCQGNQLHVTYDDRLVADTTVWYSTREVAAPHIAKIPLPVSAPAASSVTPTTEVLVATPVSDPNTGTRPPLNVNSSMPARGTTSQAMPLLASVGSVVILLVVVIGWSKLRGSHH